MECSFKLTEGPFFLRSTSILANKYNTCSVAPLGQDFVVKYVKCLTQISRGRMENLAYI
jgi:hypothetical protein